MSSRPPTIVIDCGAYQTRVGISGRDVPEETFRTVVGRKTEVDFPGVAITTLYTVYLMHNTHSKNCAVELV